MNRSEYIAKAIVEKITPGCRMVFKETQSNGEFDFDLHCNDQIDSVEVTTSTDQRLRETLAAIEVEGQFVPLKRCQKDWIIHPLASANIKKIVKEVDAYLVAIENAGLVFFSSIDRATCSSVDRIYEDLRIEGGSITHWKPPGPRVCISRPGGGGELKVDDFYRVIKLETDKEDNRKKLGKAKGKKHLFIYVDPRNYKPFL